MDDISQRHQELQASYLDDAFHEVFLSDGILALHNLLQDWWKNDVLVRGSIDVFKVAQTHEIGSDQQPQLTTLSLTGSAVLGVTLPTTSILLRTREQQ